MNCKKSINNERFKRDKKVTSRVYSDASQRSPYALGFKFEILPGLVYVGLVLLLILVFRGSRRRGL